LSFIGVAIDVLRRVLKMKKVWFFVVLLTVFVLVTLPKLGNATNEEVTLTPEQSLLTVETAENLRSILKESQSSRTLLGQERLYASDVMLGAVSKSAQTAEATAPSSANFDITGGSDHSTTNLQVEGVDEADIIKNDGQYIYQVNNQELIVTQAYPANQMNV